MAKTMKFKDDKTYGFADSSTALDCVAVVKTFAELDAIRAEFTEDNLKGGATQFIAVPNGGRMAMSIGIGYKPRDRWRTLVT